ncbi:MAG TPA: alpha/beta hydrolase [Pseudolysinimonas sp.]|jgi:acetyl esterase/lipase
MSDHIIVLPGGGYTDLAPHEGEPIAEWLRGVGVAASVFAYPVQTRHPGPLDAVRAEVRRVRAAGAERVGLLGFSAGGHAAGHATLAPDATADERVDLAILCYPVVSMELETHAHSRMQLIGLDASPELRAATSLDRLVTAEAPPFFVWHTAEDASVPVQHSYLLGNALAANGIPHALHVFSRGRHGLAFAAGEGTAEAWTTLCAAWLREEGWIA